MPPRGCFPIKPVSSAISRAVLQPRDLRLLVVRLVQSAFGCAAARRRRSPRGAESRGAAFCREPAATVVPQGNNKRAESREASLEAGKR